MKRLEDAVVRNLEVIGEATKLLSDGLRKKHPLIPWKKMAGVRDRLIHDYFGVNFDIVWGIAKQELPGLAKEIAKILGAMR